MHRKCGKQEKNCCILQEWKLRMMKKSQKMNGKKKNGLNGWLRDIGKDWLEKSFAECGEKRLTKCKLCYMILL